jgi:hypothetical protein
MVSKEELEKLINLGKNVNECCSILNISKRKLTKLRKEYGLNRVYSRFETTCGFCDKPHIYFAIKEKDIYFCSVKCSVSVRRKSEETKIKISNKLKYHFSKSKIDKFCLECNTNIKNKRASAKFCSRLCSNKQNRIKLSEGRIKYLENSKHINWIDSYNINGELIKVQGNWENELTKSLNRLGILYKRKSVSINGINRYTPDFFIPDYNIFIEVKGFLYEKDKYKMLKAIDNNKDMDLRIIFDIKKIKNLTIYDLKNLIKVINIINYEKIDFSKFDIRY